MALDVPDVDEENFGDLGSKEGHPPISCPQVHDSDSGESHDDSGESHEGQPPPRKRSKEGPSTSGSRGGNTRGIRARGRSRARGGRAQGTGRGKTGGRRVRSSTATSTTGEIEVEEQPHLTFDDPDQNMNILPPFTPRRPTGIHFEGPVLRNKMATELDIFRLFITPAHLVLSCAPLTPMRL